MLQGVLFFFLILAGSKMVVSFTFVVYSLIFISSKKNILIILIPLLLVLLFPPIQERFKEIVNLDDLSVINEGVINNPNDERVNGLTLRVLLWQESVRSIDTFSEYIFGLGVGERANKILVENLNKRGLEKYNRYSTHNQFVNLFMRTGLLGVVMLLIILGICFYKSIIYKNKLLLISTLLFTFAMLTESVLQRSVGITFFISVILLLTRDNFLNEGSNNWNKRNP